MKKMINIIGGRKMFLALILFFIACVCLFTGIAQFGEWGEFCKWLFGIFALGNLGEHVGKQFGGKANE
tara:strand:- start:4 stop:207 length:204 start_codon:yes stop_codon:yes gene_type:complete